MDHVSFTLPRSFLMDTNGSDSGVASSLFGRINPQEMGSRVYREKAPSLATAAQKKSFDEVSVSKKKPVNILSLTEDIENIKYKPRTRDTKVAWEYLLSYVHRLMGSDCPHDVTVGAADELLEVIMFDSDNVKGGNLDKKRECEELLGKRISSDYFDQLVTLCKRITDYERNSSSSLEQNSPLNEDQTADVAVVFEESENENFAEENEEQYQLEEQENEDELPVKVFSGELSQDGIYSHQNSPTKEEWITNRETISVGSILRIGETCGGEQNEQMSSLIKAIDLDSLAFSQGSHTMTNKRCILPEGTYKRSKQGYEEIFVPAPKSKLGSIDEKIIPISSLPKWAESVFSGTTSFNRIQSQVFPTAWGSDENMLMCAPTGAGKTNVAVLAILREICKHVRHDGSIDRDIFKIVYVAPMKALVQEVVGNLKERFKFLELEVSEISGDQSLTRAQIARTQILVTTPEKWDVITRKPSHIGGFTSLVRLIIFDEIHLLHDDRGPVIESLIARILRRTEETQEWVRIVGLSATLPNYMDVARFLRANPQTGVFFFDSSFRPCPLAQQFVGITERRPLKRMNIMNELVYEKVIERTLKSQIIVFVHSRKDTAKTALAIRDSAIEKETIVNILGASSSMDRKEYLENISNRAMDPKLRDLLPFSMAIHHAGLSKEDRTLVEESFRNGYISVLVSTATLAWGVNLPAHTVIIKGTQVYSPEKGRWTELSPQDVIQMLGRAGRPQYDVEGEGIILTTHGEMQFYLSLLTQQLPIESHLIRNLADSLNAEIVLGTVNSLNDGVKWLEYTYLYVRMLREPTLYGISLHDIEIDRALFNHRSHLIYSALLLLEKSHLIRFNRQTGEILTSELGKIASHYYLSHQSMSMYQMHMNSTMDEIAIFRVFSFSSEFSLVLVRQEEKPELAKLAERVPIPIREAFDESSAKINILLQSYISQLSLQGFALAADMTYARQSASRLLRAMFEMSLRRGWAQTSRKILQICLMVEKRQWLAMSPLRQLLDLIDGADVPMEAIQRLERKDFPWSRLFDLNPQELGELVRVPRLGKAINRLLAAFPRFEITCAVVPLTGSLIRLDVTLVPIFEWDITVHGHSPMLLHVAVEDNDGEKILHYEATMASSRNSRSLPIVLAITLSLEDYLSEASKILPPCIFLNVMADRWLSGEWRMAVELTNITSPREVLTAPVPIAELAPLTFEEAFSKAMEIKDAYSRLSQPFVFNTLQTMLFPAFYRSDSNLLIAAPSGSGKTLLAEFAIWRMLLNLPNAKCVYIQGRHESSGCIDNWLKNRWMILFGQDCSLVELSGDLTTDLGLIAKGTIIFARPEHWDLVTRKWQSRTSLLNLINLIIVDDLHWLGVGEAGTRLEVALSRTRIISDSMAATNEVRIEGIPFRLILFSMPIANARQVGDWMGIAKDNIYLLTPQTLPYSQQSVHLQTLDAGRGRVSFTEALLRPLVKELSQSEGPSVIIVQDSQTASMLAFQLANFIPAKNKQILSSYDASIVGKTLLKMIQDSSIAFVQKGQSQELREHLESMFTSRNISTIIVEKQVIRQLPKITAPLVIIAGTQVWEGREERMVDYSFIEIQEMISRASNKTILLAPLNRRSHYRNLLACAWSGSLPLESHLDQFLLDPLNAEISSRSVTTKQAAVDWITWSLLYRRLASNPNYYGIMFNRLSKEEQETLAISIHLSKLLEESLNDLVTSKCIEDLSDEQQKDEEVNDKQVIELRPLNLGLIAAYYRVYPSTIEMYAVSLTSQTKLRGILELIAASSEFDHLCISESDASLLAKIYQIVPIKPTSSNWSDPHVKTHLLLQAYFSRILFRLDTEIKEEYDSMFELLDSTKNIVTQSVTLAKALVDVTSSHGWLTPSLAAMEFVQMLVQAQWESSSPLEQLVHPLEASGSCSDLLNEKKLFNERVQRRHYQSLFDIIDADEDDLKDLLEGLSILGPSILSIIQRYPSIEIIVKSISSSIGSYENSTEAVMGYALPGDTVTALINLSQPTRQISKSVSAPFYPHDKFEAWWIVIGDVNSRSLFAIKRVAFPSVFSTDEISNLLINVQFSAPESPGSYSLKVYLVSDSWIGCDQEIDLSLIVQGVSE